MFYSRYKQEIPRILRVLYFTILIIHPACLIADLFVSLNTGGTIAKAMLRQLKKDGSALSNIEITDANIGLFKPCAKKYDIDFTLRKDRTTHPPRYIVIFKSKQADNLEQAFKEFTAKKLKQQERPSIRKTLAVLKEKAAARSSQQAKEKIKERGLSR